MKHLLMITAALVCIVLFACSKPSKLQGYNEAKFIYVSANFDGVIKKLYVSKGMFVKRNDPLVFLELKPQSDELEKAKADLEAKMADKNKSMNKFNLAQINWQRDTVLFNKHAINADEYDRSHTDFLEAQGSLEQSNANVLAAKANLDKMQWNVSQKSIYAPKDSFVFDTNYSEGELVLSGHTILVLLAPADVKTVFYLSEKQLPGFKLGQHITVYCDGCEKPIAEVITYISPQAVYTPTLIFSNDTPEKLAFRVEASPVNQTVLELHPGQPVTISR